MIWLPTTKGETPWKWECGNSMPDIQLLPEIAVFFGVSIDRLFAKAARTAGNTLWINEDFG